MLWILQAGEKMPLDKLIERIISEAEEEGSQTKRRAEDERERILTAARAEAEKIKENVLQSYRREAQEEKKRRVTTENLEARTALLREKQDLIKSVINGVVRSVKEMPEDEYIELLLRMISAVALKSKAELILSASDRHRIGDKLVRMANERFRHAGLSGELFLSPETRDIEGGFIIRSEGIEINNSIEALINSKREELELKIADILFGEGE